MSRAAVSFLGRKIGRLLVVEALPASKPPMWRCECDCGAVVWRSSTLLHADGRHQISCGCIMREITAGLLRARSQTHGLRGSGKAPVEYRAWQGMIQRCCNPKNHAYEYYGGRGIKVCDRWRNDYAAFIADMGAKPAGTSIDRIDVNGDYEAANCRWATPLVQSRNRRPVSEWKPSPRWKSQR